MAINLDKTKILAITVVVILIAAAIAGVVIWNNNNSSNNNKDTSEKTVDKDLDSMTWDEIVKEAN